MNDLGEPEEIFAEEELLTGANPSPRPVPPASLPFFQRLQASPRKRSSQGAVLLGVCQMLAQVSGWKSRIRRAMAVFFAYLTRGGGMEILFLREVLAYLALALIFPRQEKNYTGKSLLSYCFTQIRDLTQAPLNAIKALSAGIAWSLHTALPSLFRSIKRLFRPCFQLFKIAFLLTWTLGLMMLLIGLLVLVYYFFTGWTQQQMDILAIFPAFTKWGILLGSLAVFLLWIGGIGALLKRKLLSNTALISALAMGILALSIACISGAKALSTLHTAEITTLEQELFIPLPANEEPLSFNFSAIPDPVSLSFQGVMRGGKLFDTMMINYLPYSGEQIKAVYHYHLRTTDPQIIAKIASSLAKPIYHLRDQEIVLDFQGQQVFRQLVPFIPLHLSLDLYIPQHWKFNTQYPTRLTNLHLPERVQHYGYSQSHSHSCSDRISYLPAENAFFCPLERNPSPSQKRGIIEGKLREDTDSLTTLAGLNTAWSLNPQHNNYWELDSILWKSDSKLIAKLSDTFFNLFLELQVQLLPSGEVKILSSQLSEREQKGMMTPERIALYQGRESLQKQGFIPQLSEQNQEASTGEWIKRAEFDALLKQLERQGIELTEH